MSRWLHGTRPLSSGVRLRVGGYGCTSFIVGCAFDSTVACLAYCRLEGVPWSSIDDVQRWFQYGFADRRVNDLDEAVVPSWRRYAICTSSADRLYASQSVVWEVPSADRCSLSADIAYTRPPSQVGPEITDYYRALKGIPDG